MLKLTTILEAVKTSWSSHSNQTVKLMLYEIVCILHGSCGVLGLRRLTSSKMGYTKVKRINKSLNCT